MNESQRHIRYFKSLTQTEVRNAVKIIVGNFLVVHLINRRSASELLKYSRYFSDPSQSNTRLCIANLFYFILDHSAHHDPS